MRLKTVTGMVLTVLLIGMLTLAFNIQRAESSEPPTTEWIRTYGGVSNDQGFSVVATNDGGYIVAGYTNSFGAGEDDIWLVKVDSSGNHEWNRTYGGGDIDQARGVLETSDSGYVIAGWTSSFGAGGTDFCLVKTDADGNMQWNKTYGGDLSDRAYSIVQTTDGGYAMAGGSAFHGRSWDLCLVKVDSSGNHEWNKTYGGTYGDAAYSVVETSDGGYALAGYTASFGAEADNEDFWLVKVNSSGSIEWNKTYGGTRYDLAYSVVETSDGGYALAGSTGHIGTFDWDSWLVKVDSSGNHQWNKTYGGFSIDETYCVLQTTDGGYALAGWTMSFGEVQGDGWLVKVDSSGNHEWNETYGGGTSADYMRSVVQTVDGGYAIAGFASFSGAGWYDFWLVKVAGLPPPVGGIWVPVDKLALLAPYIGSVLTIVVATVATTVYAKRVKCRKEKQ